MTTYLLHGGRATRQTPQNEKFFGKFTELVDKEEISILLCYFAQEKEKWKDLVERDTNYIKSTTKKSVKILIAESPDDLLQKLDASDVLYVAGGEAELIEPTYKDLASLNQKLMGKVYAGSSMGAFLTAEQYILSFGSQDTKTVHKGLGLLSLQMLCHWDIEPDKERKLGMLTSSSDKPVLVLNEFEFVVMYK